MKRRYYIPAVVLIAGVTAFSLSVHSQTEGSHPTSDKSNILDANEEDNVQDEQQINVDQTESQGNEDLQQSIEEQPVKINIPPQSQMPQLYNGCEVTSLSMLLTAAGHPIGKMELAQQIKKDTTPIQYDDAGDIIAWGDPHKGFVGDIQGDNLGYGVYHEPIADLLNSIMPGQAKDLTGVSFDEILKRVDAGKPVMVWTTAEFQPTQTMFTWKGPQGLVNATFDEHTVVVVGYDDKRVYVNDPLDGTAAKGVDRKQFIASWEQMGKQAVTFQNHH